MIRHRPSLRELREFIDNVPLPLPPRTASRSVGLLWALLMFANRVDANAATCPGASKRALAELLHCDEAEIQRALDPLLAIGIVRPRGGRLRGYAVHQRVQR